MTEKAGAPRSAGLLVFRRRIEVEVLIGHMGGPFWARKQDRAWSVPKGLVEDAEEPIDAAGREFREETGIAPPPRPWVDLGTQRQRSGKTVHLYAVEADPDLSAFRPGTFTLTRGARTFEVPELDRVDWVPVTRATELLIAGQVPFLALLPLP